MINFFSHLTPKHQEEWRNSGVTDEIIEANARSLEGDVIYEHLCSHLERRNDGRLTDPVMRQYHHCTYGGWWCSGLELWQDSGGKWHLRRSQWGAFKPDNPRINLGNGKTIKYEHPPKIPTSVFMLDIPSNPRFWLEVLANVEMPLVITEGAKKAACLLSLGIPAIALPGVSNGYRQPRDSDRNKIGEPHLIPELEAFCQPGRPIFFAFDHDTKPQTVFNVRLAIARTGKLFQKAGCVVKVISLPGPEKGVDDFVVSRGVEAWQEIYEAAVDLREWGISGYLLTYTPDVELDREFMGEISIPDHARLIAVRGRKGGGKTQTIAGLVEQAYRRGQPVLVLTYREQLGGQLAQRFKLLYKTEVPGHREEARLYGYAFCVDSMHPSAAVPFRWEDWQDALVIIDEAESVIWHTLNSDTCADRRVAILNQLQNLLRAVLSPEGSGQVILSDADLSDHSVDFVKGMAGQPDLKPFTIVNHWKPEQGWQVYNYLTPANIFARMMPAIAEGHHLILATGQRADSRWGTQTLEKAIRKRYPGKSILRIDSETIADPSHPAFGCLDGDINVVLAGYDIVIASPTLESGVSIDLYNHFSAVWGLFTGSIPENSVRQFLARSRDNNVPRHIFVAERGINTAFVGGGESSPKTLLESQHRQARITLSRLQEWSIKVDRDGTINHCPAGLETWGRMGSRINRGLHNYRASVLAGLKAEGHQIIDVSSLDRETDKEISDQVGSIRDENHDQHCEAVPAAPLPPSEEAYQKLKRKRAKTESERNSQRHHELKQRYGIPVTADLVKRDDAGWYPQIRLQYLLTEGADSLKDREAKRYREIAPDGVGFIPDVNRRSLATKIEVLKFLGIDRLLFLTMAGETFTSSHSLIVETAAKAIRFAAGVKEGLGVKVSESNSPIAIVQNIFNHCLGFRLVRGQRRIAGTEKREWVYYYVRPEDGREEVFSAWLERDRAAAAVPPVTSPEPTEPEPEPPYRRAACSITPVASTPEITHDTSNNNIIAVTRNALNIFKADHVTNPPRVTEDSPSNAEGGMVVRGSPGRLKLTPGMVVRWGQRSGEWLVRTVGTAIAILARPDGTLEWSAALSELEVV